MLNDLTNDDTEEPPVDETDDGPQPVTVVKQEDPAPKNDQNLPNVPHDVGEIGPA